ncbi:hypothetical protein BGZ83_009580 [Gryganskiella cystojenkinii]|nr:hypothetical protein BGZ83_009580 [Gryganskiella cystojenkinii]
MEITLDDWYPYGSLPTAAQRFLEDVMRLNIHLTVLSLNTRLVIVYDDEYLKAFFSLVQLKSLTVSMCMADEPTHPRALKMLFKLGQHHPSLESIDFANINGGGRRCNAFRPDHMTEEDELELDREDEVHDEEEDNLIETIQEQFKNTRVSSSDHDDDTDAGGVTFPRICDLALPPRRYHEYPDSFLIALRREGVVPNLDWLTAPRGVRYGESEEDRRLHTQTNAPREASVINVGDTDMTMEDAAPERPNTTDQGDATVSAAERQGGEEASSSTTAEQATSTPTTKNKVGRKPTKPKREPAFKRGKYKPRERKDWVWQFKPYLLKPKNDGSIEVSEGEKRNLPRARPERCRITRTRKRVDYMARLVAKSNGGAQESATTSSFNLEEGSSSNAPPDTTTPDGGENFQVKGSNSMNRMVSKLIRRHAGPKTESSDPNNSIWYVEPPRMEYPYLQEAFPYDEYERTHPEPLPGALHHQSGFTARFGPLLSSEVPLPDAWYRPQGPVPADKHFSLEKLKDATDLVKTIKVDTEGLRMDVYYNRGFELASRRILDRIRAKRAAEKEQEEEEQARQKAIEARAELRKTWESAIRGGNPEEDEILAGRHISWFRDIAKSMTLEAAQKTAKEQEDAAVTSARAEAAARGSVPVQGAVVESLSALEGRPAPSESTSRTSIQGSRLQREQSQASGESSTLSSSPATASTSQRGAGEQGEAESGLREEVPLTDYYQVNTFLASMFQLKAKSLKEPLPLGPGAARIMQTLILGLETKVLAMGCHLQREELVQRMTVKAGDSAFALEVARTLDPKRRVLKSVSIKKQQQQAFEDLQRAPLPSGTTPSWISQLDAALAESKTEIERHNPLRQPVSFSPYYRLGVFDTDLYVVKAAGQEATNSTRAGTSQLASPQTSVDTPTLPQSNLDLNLDNSLPASAAAAVASSSSGGGNGGSSVGERTGQGEESSQLKWPFVGNPLEIFPSMDPFWLAREYQLGLLKKQKAAASIAAAVASSAALASTSSSSSAAVPGQAQASETEDSMDMELW